MALSRETTAWIATLCGLSQEEFKAKVSSEDEVSIERPKGEFFTEEELSERDQNNYLEGKDASREMAVKDLKKEYGYEFPGRDLKSFMAHHDQVLRDKYGSSDDTKVAQLKKDLEKQKETYDQEIETLTEKVNKYTRLYKESSISNRLLGKMPKETTIPSDDILTLFNARHVIEEQEDGSEVVKKGSEILKDAKTGKPLPVEEVFNTFVIDNKYAKDPEGRGGDNEPGSGGSGDYKGVKTMQEFEDRWKSNNPNKSTAGPDFERDYALWRKDQKESA